MNYRFVLFIAVSSFVVHPSFAQETEGSESLGGDHSGAAMEEAWSRYHEAFLQLAKGDRLEAIMLLQKMSVEHRGHPASRAAKEALAILDPAAYEGLDAGDGGIVSDGQLPAFAIESRTNLGRAELAAFQTVHSIVIANQIIAESRIDNVRVVAGMNMLFGGAGLGLTLGLTKGGITQANAYTINTGTQWGFWNALALTLILDVQNEVGFIKPLVAGQLMGTAAGVLAYRMLEPHSGEIAMASWSGIWSGAMMGLVLMILDREPNPRLAWGSIMAASNIGLVGGAFAGEYNQMSRSRVVVINLSGALGGLTAVGSYALIAGDSLSGPRIPAFITLGGALVGLGLGNYFTNSWDDATDDVGAGRAFFGLLSGSAPQVALMPLERGVGLALHGRL